MPKNQTFVMVPGAWLGGWAWKRVVPLLEHDGNAVYPLTLTGMGDRVHLASPQVGLETAIHDVINAIVYEDLEDVVLVGHSFAGKVVAAVADRIPERLGSLLFLDAYRPAKVRMPQGDFSAEGWQTLGDGWRVPLTEDIVASIGKDLTGADREWMLSKVTPWLMRYVADPVTLSEKFDSVKKAYIFCTGGGDPVEEILKTKLDGPHKVLESGHWPMITMPAQLAQATLELAQNLSNL
ncbi:MAG: alpha/beta hydrolase [Thaumarchaeota archaeon]|nr:alpha/beta hydrolase [Nitrososphaerota archaeon]